MHHKFSAEGWVLDQSSIFAQIDAFVQRCKDLLEASIFFFIGKNNSFGENKVRNCDKRIRFLTSLTSVRLLHFFD